MIIETRQADRERYQPITLTIYLETEEDARTLLVILNPPPSTIIAANGEYAIKNGVTTFDVQQMASTLWNALEDRMRDQGLSKSRPTP